MEAKQFNFEYLKQNDVIRSIVENLVNKFENESYDEFPKQNEVLNKFRDAGVSEKVRIGEYCNHAIDGIVEDVGFCCYFGHSQGAFQKMLAFQSLYEDGLIKECYYITQTTKSSQIRHRIVNPKARPNSNGNRITFDNIVSGMGYYFRFITVPMTVIGIDFQSISELSE